ncbi:CpaF family protein [Roseibium sp.]|uniref:CpaF family protein n=1 Tax=Roseibium sp. TaxID=1936156 RepID=UPI003BB1246C
MTDDSVIGLEDRRQQIFEGTLKRLLDPVREALNDPKISEIMINGHREIYVERRVREELPSGEFRDRAKVEKIEAVFESAQHLEAAARAIAQYSGRLMTPDEPSLEARLHDKSRVHIVQPPAARNGLSIAIRRFSKAHHSVGNLLQNGTLTPELADFLQVCLALKKNIVVSGGTSTGKTTILNALSEFMDETDRVIVIEDVNELEIQPPHTLYFEAQKPDRFGKGGITIRELFKASLRMRPDRIMVGECRSGEALDMIQAMTSGHSGSMTTLHADSPLDALNRLETMALMSEVDLPQRALRGQISSAVDIVLQVQRIGGRRGVVSAAEVQSVGEDGHFVFKEIFGKTASAYDPADTGPLCQPTGNQVSFARDAAALAKSRGLTNVPGIASTSS